MENISTVAIKFIVQSEGVAVGLAKVGASLGDFERRTQTAMVNAAKAFAGTAAAVATLGVTMEVLAGRQMLKAVESLSEIYDQAKKLGVTTDAMQAINVAAIAAGTQIESFRANFVHLTKAIQEVDTGVEKAIIAFRQLGISVEKLKTLTPEQQFVAMINALGQMEDQTERAQAALITFGRNYSEIRQVVEGGSEALAMAAEMAGELGRVIGTEDVENVKKLDIAMNNLKEAAQAQFNMLIASVAPMLTKLIDDSLSWAREGSNVFTILQNILYALMTPLYMIAVAMDGVIAAFYTLKGVGELVWTGFRQGIALIAEGISFLAQGFQAFFNDMIGAYNMIPFVKKVDFATFGTSFKEWADRQSATVDEWAAASSTSFEKAGDAWQHGYAEKLLDTGGTIVNSMGSVVTSAKAAGQAAADAIRKVGDEAKGVTPYVHNMDEEWNKAMKSWWEYVQAQRRTAEKYDPVSKYKQEIEALEELMYFQDESKYKLADSARLTEALQMAQTKMIIAQSQVFSNFSGALQNFGNGIADSIMSAKSMSDVLRGLARDIIEVIVKQYVLKSMFNMAGSTMGIPALGSLMFGNPAPIGKAVGGPVSSNTPYMVGEKGPELFIPKTGGYILPNGITGGGTTVVNQTIQVQTGTAQTVRNEMMSMMPMFKAQAMSGVIDAKARGGSYSKALT